MRERAEDQLRGVDGSIFRRDEGHLATADSDGRATLLVRRSKGERQGRVTEDECAELAAGISAGPEHADWYFIHTQCIIMHKREVNPDRSAPFPELAPPPARP